MKIKSLAVYCGSMRGEKPIYAEKAAELGKLLAQNKIRLVYGAGRVGLMGVIADATLAHDGYVIGVIPTFLMNREVEHNGIHELMIVEDMPVRKTKMIDLSDGFIAMPGGYGTLEEISEVLTMTILGNRKFPVGFLNVDGYYDDLRRMLDKMTADGFLQAEYRANALFASEPAELLQLFHQYSPNEYSKFETGAIFELGSKE
jgi:uncharacterized protein (TIGR00730 family)